jgi:hypothetical protein
LSSDDKVIDEKAHIHSEEFDEIMKRKLCDSIFLTAQSSN